MGIMDSFLLRHYHTKGDFWRRVAVDGGLSISAISAIFGLGFYTHAYLNPPDSQQTLVAQMAKVESLKETIKTQKESSRESSMAQYRGFEEMEKKLDDLLQSSTAQMAELKKKVKKLDDQLVVKKPDGISYLEWLKNGSLYDSVL